MRHGRATRDVRYSLSSSHRGRWMRRTIAATAGILLSAGLLGRPPLLAQANPYPVDLLPALRRAAALSPGDLPTAVRVASLNPFSIAMSYMIEGGSPEKARAAN